MTDASTQQPLGKAIKRRALLFPLTLKALVVILVSLAPLCIITLIAAGAFSIPQMPLSFLRTGVAHIGAFSISVPILVILASVALGLASGLSLANLLFIRPARRLLSWLAELRRTDFKVVPPLPHTGADEIGEAGVEIGLAALKFSRGKEQTEDSMEQRSLFITTAAHQLRTPLTALSWTVETLQRPDTTPEERAALMATVSESLSRMRLVIEHILASANVEEGKFGYVFESVDIVPIIDTLVKEFRPVSEKQNVSLSFRHDGAFPVFADKERIALAISDLIANALQYTTPGGSVVVAAIPAGPARGDAESGAGEKLEISVQDTGIGISEAERPLIFNKLYRGERARHMRPDGSGLGLYLVRNIVEKHSSEITVDSTEGKGTRFSFFLNSKREGLSS